MKNCAEITNLLGAYLDLELPPEEHREVENHLRSCNNCQDEMEHLEEFLRFAKSYTLPPVTAKEWETCLAKIQKNIQASPTERISDPSSPFFTYLYLALAAGVAAFFFFLAPTLIQIGGHPSPKNSSQISQKDDSSNHKKDSPKNEEGKTQSGKEPAMAVHFQEKNEVLPEYIETGEDYSCFLNIPKSQDGIFVITIEEEK
ncbi:MAG: zf-HC2 domain-containing protein [Planctomycetota bacterium]|nr:MAG: zf-HC2 domain-containing protein [Planctomycetota bacterium]